jgi:hypothetical protein
MQSMIRKASVSKVARLTDSNMRGSKRGVFLLVPLCFLVVYFAWYPGVFTLDEVDIVTQGISRSYHDGHSPLLVRLWEWLAIIKAGPAIPYFVAAAGVVLLSSLLLRRIVAGRAYWLIAFALFCFMPPVFVSLGLVSKDLFFVAAMLAVMLALGRFAEKRTPIRALLVLLAMLLSTLIRVDAIFALLPIAIYFCWTIFTGRPSRRQFSMVSAVFIGVAILFSLLMGAKGINRVLFDAKPYHAEQVMMLFDLASISLQVDQMLLPSSRLSPEGFPLPLLRARFSSAYADPLIWGPDGHHLLYAPDADHAELHNAWFAAIKKYPIEYIRARAEYASRFIGIRNNSSGLLGHFFSDESVPNKFPGQGWENTDSVLQKLYFQISISRWGWYVYLPWVWLLAGSIGLALWGSRTARSQATVMSRDMPQLLVASAISYTALMCFVSTASIARYHAWPRVAIGLVIAIAVTSLFFKHKPESSERSQ